jgi:hypothetical protein
MNTDFGVKNFSRGSRFETGSTKGHNEVIPYIILSPEDWNRPSFLNVMLWRTGMRNSVSLKDFCLLIPFSDPGRVTGYKEQLWSTEQSLTGGASNTEFLGLWSACGVFGSICYGTKDVLRKNNQRIFHSNGGVVLAAVAVIFIILSELEI